MKGPVRIWRAVCDVMGEGYVWFRRQYYMTFRRGYVRRMVARRRGTCGAHGCCWIYLAHRVVFRHCTDPKDRRRCRRWDNLPEGCRMYPFDEKDKNPRTRGYCNFHWDDGDDRAD